MNTRRSWEPQRSARPIGKGRQHRHPAAEVLKNQRPSEPDAVEGILAYHERSKHQPEAYARGPGGLDWATQPDPFRTYQGAPLVELPLARDDDTPPASVLFGAGTVPARPLSLANVGLLFELSMGLSARKEIAGAGWYLRMNPSSGNLHPTEAYAILPSLEGVNTGAGVYHYAAYQHALELRARCPHLAAPAIPSFWIALSSIPWREAWKYGERAFRYCQHDTGHALAALSYAAAALGWRLQPVTEWDDTRLAGLLGLDRAEDFAGAEPETPELLVQVTANAAATPVSPPVTGDSVEWFGRAKRLSPTRVEWRAVDEAVGLSARSGVLANRLAETAPLSWPPPAPPLCPHTAGQLIRQRRSAVSFDGVTSISHEVFLAILDTTLPRVGVPPFDGWPFRPRVHLVLFVHRVLGLDPGLYLWLRDPNALDDLRRACHGRFDWKPTDDTPAARPLVRLGGGDVRDFARVVSCHQDIAADSAFSLGMLTRFEPVLWERGAEAYRELFWETGMIGQALYLAAEAAGIRGTGIGCYFDDVLHQALGLKGRDWQSLYHFTVGGPVEDSRLLTSSPYAHLTGDRRG